MIQEYCAACGHKAYEHPKLECSITDCNCMHLIVTTEYGDGFAQGYQQGYEFGERIGRLTQIQDALLRVRKE